MTGSRRTGIGFAFLCLGLLGVMPILAGARPVGSDGLTFSIWTTAWQLLAALPLFLIEGARQRRTPGEASQLQLTQRTAIIALATGAMFGLSTYMYVVAAEKAGAVNMVIALQAYPLFAFIAESLFLGRRRSWVEGACTALLVGALVYLVTEGTLRVSGISWWTAYVLGIPVLWTIAHLMLRQVLVTTKITPSQVTVSRLAISGGFLVLAYGVFGESGSLAATLADASVQRSALLLGVAYYGELILWFNAMRHIDVSLASAVTVPAPAITMLVTSSVLGAAVRGYQVLAMCVMALSLYGLLAAGRRRASQAERGTPA